MTTTEPRTPTPQPTAAPHSNDLLTRNPQHLASHRAAAIPTWHEFVASLEPTDRRDAEAWARLYVQTVREIIAAREAGAAS